MSHNTLILMFSLIAYTPVWASCDPADHNCQVDPSVSIYQAAQRQQLKGLAQAESAQDGLIKRLATQFNSIRNRAPESFDEEVRVIFRTEIDRLKGKAPDLVVDRAVGTAERLSLEQQQRVRDLYAVHTHGKNSALHFTTFAGSSDSSLLDSTLRAFSSESPRPAPTRGIRSFPRR